LNKLQTSISMSDMVSFQLIDKFLENNIMISTICGFTCVKKTSSQNENLVQIEEKYFQQKM